MDAPSSLLATIGHDRTDVVVLGGGILGCLTALQCARRGLTVTLVEREPQLWSRASLHNEGKVHLGLVYALGSAETRRALLADALSFAPDLEAALGHGVDWAELQTPGFRYVVMPDSVLDADALAKRYRELDDAYRDAGSPAYLGEQLEALVDLEPSIDEQSGLPFFTTAERAVEPIALRSLVRAQLDDEPSITLALGTTARRITQGPRGPIVELDGHGNGDGDGHGDGDGGSVSQSTRLVIDCRWEQQGVGVEGRAASPRNVRVKAAVRARSAVAVPTSTLVAGPFGDLVQHRDHVYLSWYPDARLHHEFAAAPSDAAAASLSRVDDPMIIEAQVNALRRYGWLQHDLEIIEGVGGFILGEGQHDIAHRESGLHDRHGSGLDRYGDVLVPRSFKFSSAPAAARRAGRAAQQLLDRAPTGRS